MMLKTIIIFVFSYSSTLVFSSLNNFEMIDLPSTAVGPESSAFDSMGQGPYTSISDGRVLKYHGPSVGYLDYAVTSPFRYVL